MRQSGRACKDLAGGRCAIRTLPQALRNKAAVRGIACIIAASHGEGTQVATYQELREQAEKLLAQAEQMREQEIAQAIADIKEKIRLYDLTAEDLGLARPAARGPRGKAPASAPAIKYRGPNGEAWAGGPGRKPAWVAQVLKEGRSLEDYAVKNAR